MLTTVLELVGLVAGVVGVFLVLGLGASLIAVCVACFAASWAVMRNRKPAPVVNDGAV